MRSRFRASFLYLTTNSSALCARMRCPSSFSYVLGLKDESSLRSWNLCLPHHSHFSLVHHLPGPRSSSQRSSCHIPTAVPPHLLKIYDYHTVLVSCAISQSKCLANYGYATCSSIVAVERSRSSPKATRFSRPVQFIRRPRFRSLRKLFTILRD